MTGNEPQITEADLISYVDGQLEDQRRDVVRSHLASNPADARKVEIWQRQNATLMALYRPADVDVLPERLDVYRMERRLRSERANWRNLAAASVLVLAVGLTGGWFGRGLVLEVEAPAHSIVADAMQAHKLFASEVLHPVEVRADAENASSLPKWLSKRLDRKLNVPDLTRHGLSLVGGRVLPSSEGAAAQLMYEDKVGSVSLFTSWLRLKRAIPPCDAPMSTRWKQCHGMTKQSAAPRSAACRPTAWTLLPKTPINS